MPPPPASNTPTNTAPTKQAAATAGETNSSGPTKKEVAPADDYDISDILARYNIKKQSSAEKFKVRFTSNCHGTKIEIGP